jgi:uncharacterized protein (DUF4415 family)
MPRKLPPVMFDDENPEWTEEDFARARRGEDVPEHIRAAFPNTGKPRGRPVGTTTSNKTQVALRIDNDTLERFKASGPGWQSRINAALRKAVGL